MSSPATERNPMNEDRAEIISVPGYEGCERRRNPVCIESLATLTAKHESLNRQAQTQLATQVEQGAKLDALRESASKTEVAITKIQGTLEHMSEKLSVLPELEKQVRTTNGSVGRHEESIKDIKCRLEPVEKAVENTSNTVKAWNKVGDRIGAIATAVTITLVGALLLKLVSMLTWKW